MENLLIGIIITFGMLMHLILWKNGHVISKGSYFKVPKEELENPEYKKRLNRLIFVYIITIIFVWILYFLFQVYPLEAYLSKYIRIYLRNYYDLIIYLGFGLLILIIILFKIKLNKLKKQTIIEEQ